MNCIAHSKDPLPVTIILILLTAEPQFPARTSATIPGAVWHNVAPFKCDA